MFVREGKVKEVFYIFGIVVEDRLDFRIENVRVGRFVGRVDEFSFGFIEVKGRYGEMITVGFSYIKEMGQEYILEGVLSLFVYLEFSFKG